VRKIRIVTKRLLKIIFRTSRIPLALGDESEVEETRLIMSVEFKPFLKVFLRFVEPPEISVGKSQERVGARRVLNLQQLRELVNRLINLARHEIALAERRD